MPIKKEKSVLKPPKSVTQDGLEVKQLSHAELSQFLALRAHLSHQVAELECANLRLKVANLEHLLAQQSQETSRRNAQAGAQSAQIACTELAATLAKRYDVDVNDMVINTDTGIINAHLPS